MVFIGSVWYDGCTAVYVVWNLTTAQLPRVLLRLQEAAIRAPSSNQSNSATGAWTTVVPGTFLRVTWLSLKVPNGRSSRIRWHWYCKIRVFYTCVGCTFMGFFFSTLMAGILPFGAMFIELFFIFTVRITDYPICFYELVLWFNNKISRRL